MRDHYHGFSQPVLDLPCARVGAVRRKVAHRCAAGGSGAHDCGRLLRPAKTRGERGAVVAHQIIVLAPGRYACVGEGDPLHKWKMARTLSGGEKTRRYSLTDHS